MVFVGGKEMLSKAKQANKQTNTTQHELLSVDQTKMQTHGD